MKRLLLAALLVAPLAFAEDSAILENQEKVEIKEPLLRVTRPAKEWVFLNLDVLKKAAIAKDPVKRLVIDDQYSRLKVQMQYSAANANFYVYAWTEERKDVDSAQLGRELLEQTRGFFKEKGKLVGNGKAKLGKLDAWGFEVEGALASSGDEMSVSKLVVLRPEDKTVFLLSLEVPKKNLDQVKKEKKKLFTSDTVKIQ